jgi:hypothetical protein
LVIDPRRTAGETPRTVGFRLRTASLVDGRIHLELASSADDAATLRGYQAEVVVSYDGLRLELPPVPVGTTGVVVVSGPVPALRGMREATVRDIPAESIGLVLLAPDGAAQS